MSSMITLPWLLESSGIDSNSNVSGRTNISIQVILVLLVVLDVQIFTAATSCLLVVLI